MAKLLVYHVTPGAGIAQHGPEKVDGAAVVFNGRRWLSMTRYTVDVQKDQRILKPGLFDSPLSPISMLRGGALNLISVL